MTSGQSSERLIYRVEMVLPGTAFSVRDKLDWELHQSERHIGVITGEHERGLKLAILCGAEDADGAKEHALRLLTGALGNLGLGELMS